jgi:hypothetical protein
VPTPSYGFIPAKDADLDNFAAAFSAAINTAYASYGLSSGQKTAYQTLATAYHTALLAATNPATRTAATVATKDSARSDLVTNLRQLAGIAQRYPSITPTLLAAAGLPVHNTVPTPVAAPTTVPILSMLSALGSMLTFDFADETTPSSKYKPFGAIGLQAVGTFGTSPPASPEVCPTLQTTGRWPLTIDAGVDNAAKHFYIYARWITRTGKTGPWSAMVTGIVQP